MLQGVAKEKKYDTNELYLWSRNRLTEIENRPVVAHGRMGRGGFDWEFGISRCKLLYMEWNKDPLKVPRCGQKKRKK